MLQKSTEINELFSALVLAQKEMETAIKDHNLAHFKTKYADLSEVIRATRPALLKHNLAVTQTLDCDEQGRTLLVTTMGHSSGQWLSSRILLNPSKLDSQEMGKCITYFRRYAYVAITGVIVDDEDYDSAPSKPAPRALITQMQLAQLDKELNGQTELKQTILQGFKISSLSALYQDQFESVMRAIKK